MNNTYSSWTYMNIFTFPLRFRSKTLWSDPARKIQTLESFSQTEIDAGESILRALKYVNNPHLREHLKRHAKDELRHGELFRKRAQELRKHRPSIASISNKPDRLYNLSRGNVDAELNSHGFFTSDHFEKLGEIMYVAMLNIAEKKAEKSFSIHRDLIRNDLKTYAIFEKILKDERYHVSYTSKFLQQWRKEGRTKQVNEALSFAHGSRLLNTLTRISSRFGEHIGHAILYIVYFTIVIPFAFLSKFSCPSKGWRSPTSKLDANQLHSQF